MDFLFCFVGDISDDATGNSVVNNGGLDCRRFDVSTYGFLSCVWPVLVIVHSRLY